MSFWSSKHIKKSKKLHQCEFCRSIIAIGKSCYNEVGTYDGDFNNYYLCERCSILIKSRQTPWIDEYDSLLCDFWECLYETNILKCSKCNSSEVEIKKYTDDNLSIMCICDECDNECEIDLSAENLLGNTED